MKRKKTIEKIEKLMAEGYYVNEDYQVVDAQGRPATKIYADGYAIVHRKNLSAHQFIYYYFKKDLPAIIDHINRDKADNRIENLRASTHRLNFLNSDSQDQCRLIYSTKNPSIFRVQVKINRKSVFICGGSYSFCEKVARVIKLYEQVNEIERIFEIKYLLKKRRK